MCHRKHVDPFLIDKAVFAGFIYLCKEKKLRYKNYLGENEFRINVLSCGLEKKLYVCIIVIIPITLGRIG